LKRLGVENELTRLGAEPGAAVTIGDVTFDFEPTGGVQAEEQYLPTRRGSDQRLETSARSRAHERLEAKRARKRPSEDEDEDEDGDVDGGVDGDVDGGVDGGVDGDEDGYDA
jgi:GTP-binding protein